MGVAIIAVISYFIGNISPSTMLGKKKGVDIRNSGSGNAGTTNALRTLGAKSALITLLIDVLKGTLAVFIGRFAEPHVHCDFSFSLAMLCGLCVFIGHIWPVIYKFKGGKGVATAFGMLAAMDPVLGFSCLGIVAIVVLISRMMSLASIIGAIAAVILTHFILPDFFPLAVIMAGLLIFKHRSNIVRIVGGEESKFSFRLGGKS